MLIIGLIAAGMVRRWRASHLAPLVPVRGAQSRLIEILLIETPVVVALAIAAGRPHRDRSARLAGDAARCRHAAGRRR